MKKTKITTRFGVLTLLILMAALSRLVPHPPNFAPISAMALFGAAYYSQKHLAFIIPVISMWISDLLINNILYSQYFDHFVWFYQGFYWTYGAFILIAIIGFLLLKEIKIKNLILASLIASITFFLISNFGVWASGAMYPKTMNGLLVCYTAGIPFFKNTIIGDLIYSIALFGFFELAKYRFPVLQLQTKKIY